MADNNFKIGDRNFKVSKINAMKQYHIVRRIAPILSEMIPAMKQIAKQNTTGLSEDEKLEQAAQIAMPIMNGISKLSDKDSEFVLYSLLATVEMQQPEGNWARIVNGEILMFDNLELPVLLQAAGRSFMYNMTGFFGVLQRGS